MGDQLKFVQLEMMVVALGLLVLIADLAMAPSRRRLCPAKPQSVKPDSNTPRPQPETPGVEM